jgi:hypothetical protein
MAGKRTKDALQREAYWRRIVKDQPTSGLSIQAWCKQQRVTEASFYAWRRKLSGTAEAAQLVAVEVRGGAAVPVGSGLQVLVAEMRIEVSPGFDRATFRQVLDLVREAAAC